MCKKYSAALRRAVPGDTEPLAKICYDSFGEIAARHGFPNDIPNLDVARFFMNFLLSHPKFYGVAAELDGRIVGSNFLDERSAIAGVGPITVDPAVQNASIGRRLMEDVLRRADKQGAPGVRLMQAAYHTRSLSLYTKLGFDPRELTATMQGTPPRVEIPGRSVRAASFEDLHACNDLCRRVHGHDRAGELTDAINQGSARVVEHGGAITGYATQVAFFGHSLGETNEDIMALIAASPSFEGTGFHVPVRNAALFRWCLAHGLRAVHTHTLMSRGLYNEPRGAFMPSITF